MGGLFLDKSNDAVRYNRALIEALTNYPKSSHSASLAELLAPRSPSTLNNLSLLGSMLNGIPSGNAGGLLSLGSLIQPAAFPPTKLTRRNVFFSFHYDDVMRVNNVRHTEQFKAKVLAVPQSFYDWSLWESSQRTNRESLKQLIREGVQDSSVICVLAGTHTWSRPWVRYEIARAIVDNKGLLTIQVNGLNHHKDRAPHPQGPDPLSGMALGTMEDGTYRLFEWRDGGWWRYQDYTHAVSLPRYLCSAAVGYVAPLSQGALSYDYVLQNGKSNISAWFDFAARQVGR
ncbi:TIR domain-containing protein [Candidatus Phyllobacterium onerii]|uniref:TIR domain-containing protein n=1 Tax=Candidatus Phyllobacterium onerii TaxID=3020828 RepID=UPI00232C7CD7|nr:TIR domain-containing protein [Phyllobacterium sp. IY22]